MLFTFGLCIQGKHHLIRCAVLQEKEHKVMPMASLHEHLLKMHASPVPGHRKRQSSLSNYIMHCRVVACGTLS